MDDQLHVTTRQEFRNWLTKNHAARKLIWLVYFKKHTGKPRISYSDAVEEAICFGWIDSIVKRIDDQKYAQKFTPRTDTNRWSELNIKRLKKVIASGAMTQAGLAKVAPGVLQQSAKPRRPQASDCVPEFVLEALRARPPALDNFRNLAPSYRRQYVGWITAAKREATQRKRLAEAVELLHQNKKLGLK